MTHPDFIEEIEARLSAATPQDLRRLIDYARGLESKLQTMAKELEAANAVIERIYGVNT